MLSFVLGLITGSFLNVVVYRMPRGESVISPPSHCPVCLHRLGISDLIPVLGYLWLRGRCRYCSSPISVMYPLLEIVMGLVFWLAFVEYGWSAQWAVAAVLGALLIACAGIDLQFKIIPDRLTLPGMVLGLVLAMMGFGPGITASILGVLALGGLLLLMGVVFTGGMGGGDIKMGAMMGAFLGPGLAMVALVIASLIGAVIGLIPIMLQKRDRKEGIAFGPFLALGGMVAFLYGNAIVNWYLGIWM